MFFKQIKHRGDNFSYIIADDTTREAAVVDPSFNADAIKQTVKNHNFKVNYIINTHDHTDHTACNEDVRATFNAKIVAHEFSGVDKDLSVIDEDVIRVGHISIHVIHTPGHTPDSICLLFDNKLLTGDTLFVGECGRTDLPGGSVEDMYNSLFQKLMKLDDDIEVYPGHDYGPNPSSTIGLEKKTNYTLVKRTLEAFIEFMKQP
jgi:glyoxylase-like metal-dependent hydrolase (beta-lactamase superfamily II)